MSAPEAPRSEGSARFSPPRPALTSPKPRRGGPLTAENREKGGRTLFSRRRERGESPFWKLLLAAAGVGVGGRRGGRGAFAKWENEVGEGEAALKREGRRRVGSAGRKKAFQIKKGDSSAPSLL